MNCQEKQCFKIERIHQGIRWRLKTRVTKVDDKRNLITLFVIFMTVIFCSHAFGQERIISCFGENKPSIPRNVYVDGNVAYTFNLHFKYGKSYERFRAWDITDTEKVKQISYYDCSKDNIWKMKPEAVKFEDYSGNGGGISQTYYMGIGRFSGRVLAFLQPHHQGLQVLDVTDPENMYNMGGRPDIPQSHYGNQLNIPGCIRVYGNYIFQTGKGGFLVFKYLPWMDRNSKTGGPYEFVAMQGSSKGVSYDIELSKDGQYLYLAGTNSLEIYDISLIEKPRMVYEYRNIKYPYSKDKNEGVCVTVSGNILIFGTSKDVRFFDISDHNDIKPFEIKNGVKNIYPISGSLHDLAVHNDCLFVYYENKTLNLEVIDISEPHKPKFIDTVFTNESYKPAQFYFFRKATLVPEKGIIVLTTGTRYCVLDINHYANTRASK
jgi:hypothetical protein